MSKNKTINAKNVLPVQRTLVAPILPEPIFLMSPNPDNFVNISANGSEPII